MKTESLPPYELTALKEILRGLGQAPESQLDQALSQSIRELPDDIELEPLLKFTRNLRDLCCYWAGGSDVVMRVLNVMLEGYDPEPEDAKGVRRAELKGVHGLP